MIETLEDLIKKSYNILNDFSLNWLQEAFNGYYKLDIISLNLWLFLVMKLSTLCKYFKS